MFIFYKITVEQAKDWIKTNFTITKIKEWLNDGYKLEDAIELDKLGFDPMTLKNFCGDGITIEFILKFPVFKSWIQWKLSGFTINEFLNWHTRANLKVSWKLLRSSGFAVDQFLDWHTKTSLDSEKLLVEAIEFKKYNDSITTNDNYISVETAFKWINANIPSKHAIIWNCMAIDTNTDKDTAIKWYYTLKQIMPENSDEWCYNNVYAKVFIKHGVDFEMLKEWLKYFTLEKTYLYICGGYKLEQLSKNKSV